MIQEKAGSQVADHLRFLLQTRLLEAARFQPYVPNSARKYPEDEYVIVFQIELRLQNSENEQADSKCVQRGLEEARLQEVHELPDLL